jgi:hypothetical protein
MSFPDRQAAKEFILRNQLGRRNLTKLQRAKLALMLKELVEARAKEKQRAGGRKKVRQDSDEPISTKHQLAAIAGVSHDTIHKVKVIEAKAPREVKEKLEAGEMTINAAYEVLKPRKGRRQSATSKPVEVIDIEAREVTEVPKTNDVADEQWKECKRLIEAAIRFVPGIDLRHIEQAQKIIADLQEAVDRRAVELCNNITIERSPRNLPVAPEPARNLQNRNRRHSES